MNFITRCLISLFVLALPIVAVAQTGSFFEEFYVEKAQIARDQLDWGQAIEHYTKLHKKFPSNLEYDWEIAMCYYYNEQFDEAINVVDELIRLRPSEIKYHRLTANAYDLKGDYDSAINVLNEAIASMPNEGELFLDYGVIAYLRGDEQRAIELWEDGIRADPYFSENYYWATKTFAESAAPIWAIMYGEMFLNIEKGTERFSEISELLLGEYLRYLKQDSTAITAVDLQFEGRNLFQESFDNVFQILRDRDYIDLEGTGRMPDGSYSDTRAISFIKEQFLDVWMQIYDSEFPVPLFRWQAKLQSNSNLEAYAHWLLINGEPNYFLKWQSQNRAQFDNFIMDMGMNPLKVDILNYFCRKDYVVNN
ncbi:tetratricopeptide repeat protein [Chitinophagales bacterium]|nr:tetratricopeptide repeat protein [Chitinophagales bacterium]